MPQPPALDVYIGYDSQEAVAYHVLCQSILEKSSRPVRVTPINLTNLRDVFDRPRSAAVRVAHFTRGGPYRAGFETSGYADEWRAMLARTIEAKKS